MAFGDIIQNQDAAFTFADSNDYVTVVLSSTPIEGNLVLALHFSGANNSIAPGGYSEAVTQNDSGNSDDGAIYYKVAGSGESTTITCTSDAADEQMLTVLEIEGPWNATPLDESASNTTEGSTTISTGTTGTTAQADEVAAALVTSRNNVATVSGWTNSFTERSLVLSGDAKGHATATKLLSSTGTVETTATWTVSTDKIGMVATFKKGATDLSIDIGLDEAAYQGTGVRVR